MKKPNADPNNEGVLGLFHSSIFNIIIVAFYPLRYESTGLWTSAPRTHCLVCDRMQNPSGPSLSGLCLCWRMKPPHGGRPDSCCPRHSSAVPTMMLVEDVLNSQPYGAEKTKKMAMSILLSSHSSSIERTPFRRWCASRSSS